MFAAIRDRQSTVVRTVLKPGCALALTTLLLGGASDAADDLDGNPNQSGCFQEQVEAHVRQQYDIYGPQSTNHEYFGFIYRHQVTIASAVTRSKKCNRSGDCLVDSTGAAALVPRGAKILGEWHTHPHRGSVQLSENDVRGAYNNRHIKCYAAYYSKPTGDIYAWNPDLTSVPTAMASRVLFGNYTEQLAGTGHGE
jgi:hypothetical protein